MRRVLTVGAAVAVALAAGAQGAEAKTRRPATLPMSYANHRAWEQMESYVDADGQRGSNIDDESTSCKRVSRSVIDCKQSVLVWSDPSGCYTDDPGVTYAPADVARAALRDGDRRAGAPASRAQGRERKVVDATSGKRVRRDGVPRR